jgi:hypothetical protein
MSCNVSLVVPKQIGGVATAQAALTEPAGAMQMSTMDAAMHSGRVAR